MTAASLADLYRAYIDCLNRQDWQALGVFVHDDVAHNGRPFGLGGYRAMLVKDFDDIPDLRFTIDVVVSEPPRIAARLLFDCAPKGEFLGLHVDGRRVSFAENVFYEWQDSRIVSVWSIVDKAAIEMQLKRY
ncbi:MAG: ester cyclase [Janthinobacterium lividum]